MAAERITTTASKSIILTAISRLDRKNIRVMLSSTNAKCPLRTSNINNAIELVTPQHSSVVSQLGVEAALRRHVARESGDE